MANDHATTCQIRARAIKANTGLIAHHGYRRPTGQGWQTASCVGARGKPYEVSCDLLPAAIAACRRFAEEQDGIADRLMASPPATLTIRRTDAYGRLRHGYPKEIARPDGFDPNDKHRSYRLEAYDTEFHGDVANHRGHAAAARRQLAFLEGRLASWRPTLAECA